MFDIGGSELLLIVIVAIVVIKAFLAIVTRYGFGPFAWYRIVAGTVALIWLGQIG